MKQKNEDITEKVSQEQIENCILILQKLVKDTTQVFELSEEKRIALMKVAGSLDLIVMSFLAEKKKPKKLSNEK